MVIRSLAVETLSRYPELWKIDRTLGVDTAVVGRTAKHIVPTIERMWIKLKNCRTAPVNQLTRRTLIRCILTILYFRWGSTPVPLPIFFGRLIDRRTHAWRLIRIRSSEPLTVRIPTTIDDHATLSQVFTKISPFTTVQTTAKDWEEILEMLETKDLRWLLKHVRERYPSPHPPAHPPEIPDFIAFH